MPELRQAAGASSSMGLTIVLVFGAAAGLALLSQGSVLLAAAGLAALLGVTLTLRQPLIGLACLIFVTVANVSDNLISFLNLPSIAKLIAPGLAGLLLYRWIFHREKPFVHLGAIALVGGFLLVKLLSIFIAADWGVAVERVSDFSKEIIVALLALAFLERRYGFETLTWSAVLTAGALCALGAVKYSIGNFGNPYYGFSQIVESNLRFSGPIGDPNFFGAVLVFMVPLALHTALNSERTLGKLLGLTLLGLIIFGILMTKSRGALVAATVSLIFLAPFLERRHLYRLVVIVGIAVMVGGALLSEEIVTRLFSIVETAQAGAPQDPAVEGRLASWSVARQLFFDHPILGVGAGNFNTYYQDYALQLGLIFRGEGRSAHSLYLEILAESGLVGITWFAFIVGAAVSGALRASALARRAGEPVLVAQYAAFGAALVGYLAAMAFLHDAFPRFLWIVLVTGIALPQIAQIAIADRAGGAPAPAPADAQAGAWAPVLSYNSGSGGSLRQSPKTHGSQDG